MKIVSQLVFIISCSLLLISCGKMANNVATGTEQQIFHAGNGTEPQGLDPHLATGVTEHNIIATLLEGLISEHPETLAPLPGAASSWDISEDLTTYTFHLNPNGKWSNGDSVTANDFVYSWQRLLMPDLAAEYAYQLFIVTGAEDFNKGVINDFAQVGAKALDELTFQVKLNAPTPYFLSMLTHYSTFPVHRKTIEKFGAIDDPGSLWTRAGNYVGNGAFQLTEWALNRIIRVQPNRYYWDAKTVRLKEIRFYPIDNLVTEERMFRAKALHLTNSLAENKIAKYKANKSHLLTISPYLGTYFYRFNTTKPPLDDYRVRQALAMSIDRQKIIDAVVKGGQSPAYNLTPAGTLGYTPRAKIEFDIDKAKQLLVDAGYPNGAGIPAFDILYNTSEGHRKIAVALQQMWKTNLGINVNLYNQDWKSYLFTVQNMDYVIARASWIGDYVDPNTFLDMFVTGGGNNQTGFSNSRYDQLIRQAAKTTKQSERYELFQQAEAILVNKVPIMPIYTYAKIYLKAPEVTGWYDNVLDHHPYKYVYLEKQAN
ncbi:MAG: oligopeptide transport system substrate-binding protein [Pseudomonadales bacterium]|jgi:oligopeptide transport system substrate-binding protein